jgi:hypothetical protein
MIPRFLVAAGLLALAAGCGGGTADPAAGTVLTALSAPVVHPHVPTTPGVVWVYEGVQDGRPRHEEVRCLDGTVRIAGVSCTARRQETWEDGRLVEVTTEWFGQDRAGNVWKVGEETLERAGDGLVPTDDSWVAGEDGAWAWIAFPAHPMVGDVLLGYRPDGEERWTIASLDARADVPAGSFEGCLAIEEGTDDPEDEDVVLYAAGVGRVAEESPAGRMELVGVEVR